MLNIKDRVKQIENEVIDIRRYFHKYPELSNQEFRTMNKISEHLKAWSIEHENGVAKTGVMGIIRGRQPGKTIAIRADIDALPIDEANETPYRSMNKGVMHACGHDAHTAILLGVGRVFKQIEDELKGNIKLLFQPAEETIGGAERMIKAGCLQNPKVDYALGLHVSPNIEAGKIQIKYGKLYTASDMLTIKAKGKSAHGASPDKGIDPMLIAANIILALQTIVSRNLSPFNPVALTIGQITGGTKGNIIAGEIEMQGILRTLDSKTRTYTRERIRAIVESAAQAYGGEGELIINESYPPLINDESTLKVVEETARKLIGEENVVHKEFPNLGAEDFAYFAQSVKSCFFEIGCRNETSGYVNGLHNNYFDLDEKCLGLGILLQVENALALMNQ